MGADVSAAAHTRRYRNPKDGAWHVQITQGEGFVTAAPDEVLTTVLGSCVAACVGDRADHGPLQPDEKKNSIERLSARDLDHVGAPRGWLVLPSKRSQSDHER
jgi:hypothetical protein